jgi:hypothetical protein
MLIDPTDVHRQSIHHSPVSNTELNLERLPDAKALAGMELRFRPESQSSFMARYPFGTLVTFLSLGSVYTLGLYMSPQFATWLWLKLQETQGMAVVGSMIAALLAMIVALGLVFLPKDIRRGLAALSLPVAVLSAFNWFDSTIEGTVAISATALFAAVACRQYCQDFYNSWLSADPRMTTAQARAWASTKRRGWMLPNVSEGSSAIDKFLTYESSQSQIPGVWIAPSSRSLRTMVSALFAGCLFSLVATNTEFHLPLVVNAPFALACLAFPLLGLTVWIGGEACWLIKECEAGLLNDQRSAFERHSDRLRNSEHTSADAITGAPISEADHLFLGWEPWQKFPILLHQPMLHEHVHISGRTGAGKTSMALMQKLIQLIKGHRSKEGQWSEKVPVVIIDLKGDEVLFQTAKAEAEKRGQKFRFFTLEPGRASFHFNPFLGFKSTTLTVPQLVQLCLDSLDLYHGTGYGRGYYSQRSRYLLSQALRNPLGVDSFQDLYARLKTLYTQHPDDFRDAFELLSVIESLTYYDQLVTTQLQEQGDETIRLDRMLEDREVVYFSLPSVKESVTVAQVGKLVLFNLRTAAHERQVAGKEKRQMFLIIDEFQKLAGENFQQILQQARSAGIAAILANQSLADLKTPDWDLTPTIRTNTRAKMYFSITEPDEIQTFRELSGEELQTFGVNEVEEIRPRFSTKELASLSDHPKRLLLQVSSGSGYTQFGGLPIPVETDWPISRELSDKRAAMPWPTTPVVIKATPTPKPQKASAAAVPIAPVPQVQRATVSAQPPPASRPAAKVTPPSNPPPVFTVPATPPTPKPVVPKPAPVAAPIVPPPPPYPASPSQKSPQVVPLTVHKKKSRTKAPPPTAKPAPTPAVKQAFAQKIQSLMNE